MVANSEGEVRRGRRRKCALAIGIGLIVLVASSVVSYQLPRVEAAFGSPSPPLSLTPAESTSGQGWAASTSATSITTNSFATANADVLLAAVTIWSSTVVPAISDSSNGYAWTSCGSSSAFSTSSAGTSYAYCFYTNIGNLVSSVTVTATTSSTTEMSLDVVSFSGMIAITNIGSWGYESGATTKVSAVAFPTESLVIVAGFARYSGAVTAAGFTEDSGGTDVPQDYPAIFWDLGGAKNNTNYVNVTAQTPTAAALIMLAIMSGSAAEADGVLSMTSGPVGTYAGGTVAVCLTTYETTLSSLSDSLGDAYTSIVSNYVNTYDSNQHQYLYATTASATSQSVTVTAQLATPDYAQMEVVVIPSSMIVTANSSGASTDVASFQYTLTNPNLPHLGMICQGVDRYSGALVTSPAMARGMDGYLPPDAFNNIFVAMESSASVTETITEGTATDVSTILAIWQMTPIMPHNGWTGYDGNATIYPTVYENATPLPALVASDVSTQLPKGSACGSVVCAYNGTWPTNSLAINTTSGVYSGAFWTTTNGANPPGYEFFVQIIASTSSSSQLFETGCPTQNFSCSVNNELLAWTPYQGMQAKYSGLPSGLYSTITNLDKGLNMTGTVVNSNSGGCSSCETAALSTILDFLGLFVDPAIGAYLTLADISIDLVGLMAAFDSFENSSAGFVPSFEVDGSGSIGQFGQSTGGHALNWTHGGCTGVTTWNYPDPNPCAPNTAQSKQALGWNTFGQSVLLQTDTGGFQSLSSLESLLGSISPGKVTLKGTNYAEVWNAAQESQEYGDLYDVAANASISYGIAPAVSIGGDVDLYPGGPGAGGGVGSGIGALLTLQQNCGGALTDFVIPANESTGYWHFFADPGCRYSYTVSYNGYWYTYPVSIIRSGSFLSSLTATAGTDHPNLDIGLWGGAVNFVESGLPEFTSWSATLNGSTQNSGGGTTNSFLIANGSYPFSIGSVSCYSISASIASPITVSGSAVTDDITFTQTCSYSVTIHETGLPSGDTWTAGVGNTAESTSGSSLTFSGLAGSNSWTVDIYIVSESCAGNTCTVDEYVPSPSSGTVTGATTIDVTFTYEVKVIRT